MDSLFFSSAPARLRRGWGLIAVGAVLLVVGVVLLARAAPASWSAAAQVGVALMLLLQGVAARREPSAARRRIEAAALTAGAVGLAVAFLL